ncbi:MAG: hypothetical protein LBO09_09075 [Candidatus Peribacteria bacterium]|jgi:hypothetical protein|nr:hypothetical protein [Candidatus Peribacteria bacterium]
MKKIIFFIATVMSLAVLFSSCKHKEEERIDAIYGMDPVSSSFIEGVDYQAYRGLDSLGRVQWLNEHREQLTRNILKTYPCIEYGKRIKFAIINGKADSIQSGDGYVYDAAVHYDIQVKITEGCHVGTWLLACENGMLKGFNGSSLDGGTGSNLVIIQPGKGIAHYLPDNEWKEWTSLLNVPIKNKKTGKFTPPQTYKEFLGVWEGKLFSYDELNLDARTVRNKNGQLVDFPRRIAETEKANAKTKTKTKAQPSKNKKK